VTRQVAVRGTQTINYQVAKVVPVCTTRKVAVNTVRMVSQEVVTQRPVTVFKTVPMGSSLALGVPAAAPTTTTALQPTNDATPIAIKPKNSSKAAATERTAKNVPSNLNDDDDAFERDNNSGNSKSPKSGSIKVPATNGNGMPASGTAAEEEEIVKAERPIGRWVARKKTKARAVEGPSFPEVAQARVKASKK